MARVVCLGSALQDIILTDHDDFTSSHVAGQSIFGQLVIGSKVNIDNITYDVGGGGTNAAASFARHGHETIFIGNIARDPAGEAILQTLDREGIDNSYVGISNRLKTGCSVILLDSTTGERTILTHRGASSKFNNFDESDLDLIQPDWLYVTSIGGDMDTLLRFFEKAHAIGAKIMFNPGKLELEQNKKLLGLLSEVDILLVNKREATSIVPGEILSELISKLSNYVESVIITDASMGAIATDGKTTYRLGIYEDVPVRDATGAGDAFGAGFLAHFIANNSFRDSLIFGAANSTSVISHIGAKKGILTGQENLHPMPVQEVK